MISSAWSSMVRWSTTSDRLWSNTRTLTPIALHVHVWSPQRRQPKAHLQEEGDKCPPSTLPLASLNQTYALRCQGPQLGLWTDVCGATVQAGGALSPRSRAKAGKDKAKAQKRRSWNLKLGNPLAHNP